MELFIWSILVGVGYLISARRDKLLAARAQASVGSRVPMQAAEEEPEQLVASAGRR